MLARIPDARATKDVDFAMRERGSADSALEALDRLASKDLGDFCSFRLTSRRESLDENGYSRLLKLRYASYVGDEEKDPILIDLSLDCTTTQPAERATPANRVEIEGVAVFDYLAYPLADQLADKLCAVMELQPGGWPSSRMKDLVDIVTYAKRVLELLGVGVLKAPSREDVDVVRDYMGVRDVPDVVDDGHLALAEVLARPGNGELARPLAEALKLSLDRGELLRDVGRVHGLAPEVVGDAVQGVGRLVLPVAPLVELAVEAVRAGEVEHHVAARRDVFRRRLQEQPHERGCGDAQSVCEHLCAFNVRFADACVQTPVESLHGSP